MHSHLMNDPAQVKTFTLAGYATLTLKSQATERHYTYKVSQAKNRETGEAEERWFVSVLTDGDQYRYAGMIGANRNFMLTRGSKFGEDAGCVKAFRYFWDGIVRRGQIMPQLEVRHEGRCGRCGRELTHPSSIDSGIGPICAGLM